MGPDKMPQELSFAEAGLTPEVMDVLIAMSADWEAENSCHGYRTNEASDIEGRRIFLAKDGEETVGRCRHDRFLVESEKFMAKAQSKATH